MDQAPNNPDEPFLSYLPDPDDATINLLRRVDEKNADAATFTIGLSSLESPSARLAFQLYQIEKYGNSKLVISVGEIQKPDPRIPHQPVEFVLWKYEGTEPKPAFPPPSAGTGEFLGAIAASPFERGKWIAAAWALAGKLGAQRAGDLLGAMLYPPPRPPSLKIWDWVHRIQIASAYTVAFLDPGWENSVRKRCLFSLARGPMDWTVGAAVLALGAVAERESGTAPSIGALYLELLGSLPRPGGVPYYLALLWSITRIIGLVPTPLQTDLVRKFKEETSP
jgi:hypothetical protein